LFFKIKKSNHRIKINGNTAVADFDQVTTNKDGTKWMQHSVCVLEKIGGAWKFIGASFHNLLNK
jgi:hypothetical protein